MLSVKSKPDRAVTRVESQSREAALQYVSRLPLGSTIAFCHKDESGTKCYWLASKQSQVRVADVHDNTTGVKKGENIVNIIWYECVSGVKFKKLDYVTVVSVSSALVTVSGTKQLRTDTT